MFHVGHKSNLGYQEVNNLIRNLILRFNRHCKTLSYTDVKVLQQVYCKSMIQSSHQCGLQCGRATALGFAALTIGPFGASPHSTPVKLDSDKFDYSTADQTNWLD